jgi:hypothetical protein
VEQQKNKALKNDNAISPEERVSFAGEQMEKLAFRLEALRIAQYLELLERPGKLIAANFFAGIARGLGIAIGASLVFALLLAFLKQLIVLNIPLIGDFIADIIQIVEEKNGL